MQDIFGVIVDGVHIDTSKTERGAKNYATRNGHLTVSVRMMKYHYQSQFKLSQARN